MMSHSQSGNSNAFGRIFELIKKNAAETGNILSDEEITDKLGISMDSYRSYLANESAPAAIYQRVLSVFAEFAKGLSISEYDSYESVHHAPPPPDPENPDSN